MRAAVLGAVGATMAAVLGMAPAVRADVPSTPDPVRIMVLGDSVSQGSAGDWTWRYRLWQHLVADGVDVDLVGPRQDLADNLTPPFQPQVWSDAYADPAFDRDHAARWGMWAGFPDVPIRTLIEDYRPDVVVSMLGVNDILLGRSAEETASSTSQIVTEARAVDPTVDVVLAEATQKWFPGVADFNSRLPGVAAGLSTPESRVLVATTSAGYDMARDTWDTSHPNARGEVRIAAAVEDRLADLGVGTPAGPLPAVEVGPRAPAVLAAVEQDGSRATLTWQGPPGATGELVWVRDVTAGGAWHHAAPEQRGSSWTSDALSAGHTYRFRLQPVKGDDAPEGQVYSNVVTVASPPGPPGRPRRLIARARQACAVLAWRPATAAARYQVRVRHGRGWRSAGTTRARRFVLSPLPSGRVWAVRVVAWRGKVVGGAATVRVRRGTAAGRCR